MTVATARRRRDPTAAMVVAGLAAALFAVAVLGALGGRQDEPADDARPASTDAWVAVAEDAFAPFHELPDAWRTLDEWRGGTAAAADVSARLAQLDDALATVEPALADLGPHPDAPLAAPLHLATAQLYDIAIDVQRVAVRMAAGDAAHEVDLTARRLAVLANRVFDRGRAAVGAGPAADIGPDVIVHRPEPVPSWADEGLAAAAADRPVPVAGPVGDWADAVRSTAPDLGALDQLLAAGDADELLAFANELEAATMTLLDVPDNGSDRSTRVLLGFLLRVEAARLAATAQPQLRDAATAVAAVAASPALWDSALGPLP